MYIELVMNVTEHETRVAVLEDGTLVEIFYERRDHTNNAGNIYKGRVQRVLPGMQAAFVDIGLPQAAFLHARDILGHVNHEYDHLFLQKSQEAEIAEAENEQGPEAGRTTPIEDLITDGQQLLVQVSKSPIGSKGARLTCHLSLPGRFLVLMPTAQHIGISRRIVDEHERQRLKDLTAAVSDGRFGYIVRTAAEGIREEKLAYEMAFLQNLWENIQKKYQTHSAPRLLHQELDIVLRAVRDLLTREADKVIIDSNEGYESILAFLKEFMPRLQDSVEFYNEPEPIFDAYNLEVDISRALKKKVWLKSGGYIVIEQTEALVAIDVNTGRYVGKHNLEETILKTNLEAVKEIAYQVRLRDLGGIIIIDFIDMEKSSNQEKVFNALKEALKKDRSKNHILPISEIGLVQMTRKRVRQPLNRMLCEPCFYCEGEGYLLSMPSVCYNIYREVLREGRDTMGRRLTLRVNPEIAELLHGEENRIIQSLEHKLGKEIEIYPNPKFHMEEFDTWEALSD